MLDFMGHWVDEEVSSYLCKFLSISLGSHLKNIVFMCRLSTQIDDRPALDGCGAMLGFYGSLG